MKLTRQLIVPAAMGMFLVLGPQSFGQSRNEQAQEQPVQLSQVPQPARNAAQKALGAAPTEAKVVVGTSPQEYELWAKDQSGKAVSVHVLADGKVLKKEKERKKGAGY